MRRRISWLPKLLLALGSIFAAFNSTATADDQVVFASSATVNELRRVGVSLEVGGNLLVHVDGKEQQLPMQVKALLRHQERLLEVAQNSAEGRRSVRFYDDVQAELQVDGKQIDPELRDDRRLLTVAVAGTETTITGLFGPHTREELDLIKMPADSLILDRLLPGDDKPREIDASWKHDADTMTLLLGLDAVGSTDAESKLYELTDEMAMIEINGLVHGAVDGIATKIELRGRYYFDRQRKQITGLEMHWKEKRAVGHTSPGVDVAARLKLHVTPLEEAPMLLDEQLEGRADGPRVGDELLEHIVQGGRIRFLHDRRWHVTQEAGPRLTMRLVDDGELIAQCNLVEQKPLKEGNRVSLDKFQDDIRRVLGDKFGDFRRAKESMDSAGHIVYQVDAEGTVSGMPIKWIYYLISSKDGRRVSLVFTMEGPLVEKFASLDEGIVSSLELLDKQPEEAIESTAPQNGASAAADQKAKQRSILKPKEVDRSASGNEASSATKR